MILQKKTINNVPTLVPLTADTGSGVPVGTIIGQYKKVNMAGYLYLDGSTFDQTLYPALYAYLGTNVLPDYREFVLVGAEQNATSATIETHDVFTQGQEKDDQLQEHRHNVYGFAVPRGTGSNLIELNYTGSNSQPTSTNSGRKGTTTRTKEKAVFWYIKATTGIIESEATEMLNVINENNSYSTNEVATGKTWIDGKPIYRKCGTVTINTNSEILLDSILKSSYVDNVIDSRITLNYYGFKVVSIGYIPVNEKISMAVASSGLVLRPNTLSLQDITGSSQWVIEYTKTTD